MKSLMLLIMGMLIFSCATPMKKIKKEHDGSVRTVFNKYRSVLNNHEWEIRQSDAEGGFLKAVKAHESLGIVVGIFQATLSCNPKDNKTSCFLKINRCNNTVPLSGCSPLSKYHAKENLNDFLSDINNI